MADSPTSHRDVIDRWPSLRAFADDIGETYNTTKAMRRRGSIPVEYWPRVVASAVARGIEGISYETLTILHPKTPAVGDGVPA